MDKNKTAQVAKLPENVQDADFRIVAEDAPVMLWLTNADGKVVFTNSKWKRFVGLLKYADYSADGLFTDTKKLWVQLEYVW